MVDKNGPAKIPPWLNSYLAPKDLEGIASLIGELEKKTQAELVPLIVRSSVDLKLFRSFMAALFLAVFVFLNDLLISTIDGPSGLSVDFVYFLFPICGLLLGYFLGGNTYSLRFFFSRDRLEDLVYKRACFEFFANKLDKTESRSAVLFMYSTLERKAMIVADPNLHFIKQTFWQEAVEKMISQAKRKRFYQGFKEALEFTAIELEKNFPASAINKNELDDRIIIKEY